MLCSMLAMPVMAANNQGLEWAVAHDDTYYYDLTVDDFESEQIEEEFYFVIDSVPLIPDDIGNWTEIPFPSVNAYWHNGTSMGFAFFYLIAANNIVLPIGNWPLLTSLVDTQTAPKDVGIAHDSDEYWGYTYWMEGTGPEEIWKVEVDFLKSSGIMALYDVEIWNTTSDTRTLFIFSHLQEMIADSTLEDTNQNLTWGVAAGDTFEYTLAVYDPEEGMNQEFYVDVQDDIPLIPYSVFRWDQILYPGIDAMWANDTSMGLWALVLVPAGNLILPIGNWSLMSAIVNTRAAVYDIDITDDSYYWGYTYKTPGLHVDETADLVVKYLKSDGALAYYKVVVTNTTSGTVASSVEVLRQGLPTPPTTSGSTWPAWLMDNLLYIGIGVGAVVVIALVVCLRRR